jgi:hypothetical protein
MAFFSILLADGKERPAPGAPGIQLVVTRPNPRSIEMLAKRDGKPLSRGLYEVSADGATLTAATSGVGEKGREYQAVIVFDRR